MERYQHQRESQRPQERASESIRAYRARKSRPCDHCRARRRRCIIAKQNDPCSLCIQTKRLCTFLRDRPKSGRERSSAVAADANDGMIRERSPSQSDPLILAGAAPAACPLPVKSTANVMSPLRLLEMVRGARETNQRASSRDVNCRALESEVGEDEELYLVGTASEREALVLNKLTTADTSAPSEPPRMIQSSVPGVRVRQVSPTMWFVFYKRLPYCLDGDRMDIGGIYDKVRGPVNQHVADGILSRFHQIEGRGLPIFSSEQQPNEHLQAFWFIAGLIYTPSFRHIHREAYMTFMSDVRRREPRVRLWMLQIYLLDLDGREAINPGYNFITLGLAVSVARLLGLNEDCSEWSIPTWEKDLRVRIWWALLVHDKLSSLSFGRPQTIHCPHNIPLPRRTVPSDPSIEAFITLCELVVILDRLRPQNLNDQKADTFDKLATVARDLDRWKAQVDDRGLFSLVDVDGIAPPGVKSLNLAYLGGALILVREIWNRAGSLVQDVCLKACLRACETIVDFVCALSDSDVKGYWSSSVVMASDRTDQSDDAIWQAALFALRKFISTLTRYTDQSQWDIAELTLARARYFVPILARQASEFQVALLPLQSEGTDELTQWSLDEFVDSLVDFAELEQIFATPAFPDSTI